MDGGAWKAAVHGVAEGRTRLSDITFTSHSHALEKEMATHSSVLGWRIPGTGEPGGLLSMGSHRVRHDWSDLATAAPRVTETYDLASEKKERKVNLGEHLASCHPLPHSLCSSGRDFPSVLWQWHIPPVMENMSFSLPSPKVLFLLLLCFYQLPDLCSCFSYASLYQVTFYCLCSLWQGPSLL